LQAKTGIDAAADNEFAVRKREIAFRTVLPYELEVRHGNTGTSSGLRVQGGVNLITRFGYRIH
jgi:hypothetical protein